MPTIQERLISALGPQVCMSVSLSVCRPCFYPISVQFCEDFELRDVNLFMVSNLAGCAFCIYMKSLSLTVVCISLSRLGG